jgi:hypothetical protein
MMDFQMHVHAPLEDFAIKFDAHNFVLASFSRAISGAPLENRRKVFRLIAADSFRRCCGDLWELADESGLIDLVGEVTITEDLTSAFWGGQ